MIVLLALPVIAVVALVHRYLQICAPSNLLIAHAKAARPTLWGAASLGALALLLISLARLSALSIENGAPGWLNLLVLVLLWDALKFLLVSVSVVPRALVAAVGRVRRSFVSRRCGSSLGGWDA